MASMAKKSEPYPICPIVPYPHWESELRGYHQAAEETTQFCEWVRQKLKWPLTFG